jgi:hypothetical protein
MGTEKKAKKRAKGKAPSSHPVVMVDIGVLKPHPRNYKKHPEEQLRHLGESLKQHGQYKNIVVAKDDTILAGHGIYEAAKLVGMGRLAVVRMNLRPDSVQALKIVTADNELPKFADSDDRQLTELLQQILKEDSIGLLGTGYDERNLAALVMVTRPESEIRSFDAAAEWVGGGMPEYEPGEGQLTLNIQFESEAKRDEAVRKLGLKVTHKMRQGRVWAGWYPERQNEDLSSLAWKSNGKGKGQPKKQVTDAP